MRPPKFIDPEVLRKHVHYNKTTGRFTLRIATARLPVGHVFSTKYFGQYISVWVDGQNYQANRAAWVYVTGKQPKGVIAHEDGLRHNNRWSNLRDLTHQQNCLNKRCHRAPVTKEPG